MKLSVTDDGVLLPKQWFPGVSEVEVRRENGSVVIVPADAPDPIYELGTQPIKSDVDDASVNHDRYLSGS